MAFENAEYIFGQKILFLSGVMLPNGLARVCTRRARTWTFDSNLLEAFLRHYQKIRIIVPMTNNARERSNVGPMG